MQIRNIVRVTLSSMLMALMVCAQQTTGRLQSNDGTIAKSQSNSNYAKLPAVFEANQGQVDSQVKFLFRGQGYTAFLTSGSMVLSLRPVNSVPIPRTRDVPTAIGPSPASSTIQFRLSGAAKNPAVVGEDQKPGKVNYFIGRDPAKWRTNVPIFGRVRYKNVYPGIDLVYYGSGRQLECDFAVSPGANPNQVQFEIEGANLLRVDAAGNLLLRTNAGELQFASPVVYQESNGARIVVDGGYVMSDPTHFSFHVAHYDPGKSLVIDPVLVYSTYLGGSGTDQPAGVVVDSSGSVYIAGATTSPDFPLATLGSLPTGANHVFVSKFDPTGSNLVYSDYIGGSNQDFGYALALDTANHVYVTGSTESGDFPVVNPYQSSLPGAYSGFLSKISADGSSLLYSTYLGGNAYDQPSATAVNSAGEAYVAGFTSSQNFPISNAYQPAVSPNQGGVYGVYGFLTKFSVDGSSLVYSTYLAGNLNVPTCPQGTCWPSPWSLIYGLALDSNDNAYVAGTTNTYNFPATPGAYLTTDSAPQNTLVSFASKFSSAGTLDYSTYLYGASGASAQIAAIAVDGSGSAYVTGEAPSDGTFPITSTMICDPQIYFGSCSYAFVTKFDPTGSSLQYSTFLGPFNGAFPHAIAVDQNNDAYVLSLTSSPTFTAQNGIEGYTSPDDLLIAEIDPTASSELFATYVGGSGAQFPAGIAVDSAGDIYVGGQTVSTDFPVTSAAFQDSLAGAANAFVLKIAPNSAPAFTVTPAALQYSIQQVGTTSPSQAVLLRNMGSLPLLISSITVSGDFAETDNCGSSVPAAGNCTFSVTFDPTGPWTRLGSIQVQDDAAGSPHFIKLSGIGSGGRAVLAPASVVFSTQPVGSSSTTQNVTLTNGGNAPLNITSIQATGDYKQTNNCPATVTPSFTCTISVTFTPTASGVRTGTLTANDDAYGSPQVVNLTGTGSSTANLTPTRSVFPSQPVGSSSAAQTLTLVNTGKAALNITSIQATGDYAQTNTCPATLANGSSCTIHVTFTPTVSGTRNGTLNVSDDAEGSPQVVNLSGVGADFSLASSPSSDRLKAGKTGTYQITISPLGGAFTNAIKLSCNGTPALAACSVSPNTVTPNGSAGTATLTITTTESVAQAIPLRTSPDRLVYAIWAPLQGVGLFGLILAGAAPRSKKLRAICLVVLVGTMLAVMVGCAGGTGITTPPQTGTAPGTYTITVTGTSGGLQHSLSVALTVQ